MQNNGQEPSYADPPHKAAEPETEAIRVEVVPASSKSPPAADVAMSLEMMAATAPLRVLARLTLSLVVGVLVTVRGMAALDTLYPIALGQRVMMCLCVATVAHLAAVLVTRDLSAKHMRISIAAAEFAAYLMLFFLVDRTRYFTHGSKTYNMDSFWFIVAAFFVAGFCTLTKIAPAREKVTSGGDNADANRPVPASGDLAVTDGKYHVPHLNRHQTEEWKGWMQMMFLWYHYFENKSIYNSIRLFIAAYVFMTGYGNFSYYYYHSGPDGDFSVRRFLQMQWRLNFFALCMCFTMNNEYMLYYICPLHTLFTLIIYGALWARRAAHSAAQQQGTGARAVLVTCGALLAASVVAWDIPGLSRRAFFVGWWPLSFLVGYHDPYRPQRPVLDEWFFRSKLDHLVWIPGMLCAFAHPAVERGLRRLDAQSVLRRRVIKSAVAAACGAVMVVYYRAVLQRDKKQYNPLHPYTSVVPLLVYAVLRNLTRVGRMHYLWFFEWLGKITLETYIVQYHIWMLTTGNNGSPKHILCLLPVEYPLCNFMLTSVIMTAVSRRVFVTTNIIKDLIIPPADTAASNRTMIANLLFCFGVVCAVAVALATVALTYEG